MRAILMLTLLAALGCGDGSEDNDLSVNPDVDLAQSMNDLAGADLTNPNADGGGNVDASGGQDFAGVACNMIACTPGMMADQSCKDACGSATATCVGVGGGMHMCMP